VTALAASSTTGTAVRATAAATLTATISILPVFLLGATAVPLRGDLGFGETGLGLAVAAFWATMALGGVPGGRLVQRLGPSRAIRGSALVSAASMLGASTARSWGMLVVWMLCAGVASGFGNPATDLTVAWTVPDHRRGIAFGVKQSAVPGATLLAGLAVPVLALTVGWRWAFVSGAAIAIPILLLMPSVPYARGAGGRRLRGDSADRAVLLLAAAAGLAMSGMTAMGAFYVESADTNGVSLDTAGALLAVGSLAGVLARFFFAWGLADSRRPFLVVASLTGLGGLGLALMATGATGALLLVATIIAFGAGWGWNGLFVHAVVRVNPEAPAAAMGVIVSATAAGGVAGPLLFGVLVVAAGYPAAWLVAAATFVGAAGLMVVSARRLGE
jgi:predicted MFS family arabinose efflux permease